MTTLTPAPTNRWSAWGVLALTLLALGLGWIVKGNVEKPGREVVSEPISILLPTDWVVTSSEDTLFIAWSVVAPERRCYAWRLPRTPELSLANLASQRNLQRGLELDNYRVLEQTPVLVNDLEGYKVSFAYVDGADPTTLPQVIQGVDYFFPYEGEVIGVTFEDEAGRFAASTPLFQRLLATVDLTAERAAVGEDE